MKQLFLLFGFSCVSMFIYAQKIEKVEIDKFTGAEIIETTSESLYVDRFLFYANVKHQFIFCIRRVNGEYSMPATIVMDDIVKYEKGDGVIFLLGNGEIVTLETNYTGIGSSPYLNMGYSFSTNFSLTDDDVEKLKNNKVETVRVTYLGGYYDVDLKSKKSALITKSLKLFDKL